MAKLVVCQKLEHQLSPLVEKYGRGSVSLPVFVGLAPELVSVIYSRCLVSVSSKNWPTNSKKGTMNT